MLSLGVTQRLSYMSLGKTILIKLQSSIKLQNIAQKFYEKCQNPQDIGNTCVTVFEELMGKNQTLSQIRRQKFASLVASDWSNIDPALLPPTPRAAYFHGLRVYHQVQVWECLSKRDMEPEKWGWKFDGVSYKPIMTDMPAGPDDILRIIKCGCKSPCGSNCSCRKSGLKCSLHCKECHGTTCSNQQEMASDDELDH